jgi:hypothetical protein
MPDTLARARTLTRLLDSAARVPGTGIRFGLDPILGLVPGLGDVAGAALAGYMVLLGARAGASRTTIVRMIANVAIDAVGGTVPLLGDAFDVAFKANSRNLALLERTLGNGAPSMGAAEPPASRMAVWGSLLALALLAAAGITVAYFVVIWIAHALNWDGRTTMAR